MSDDADRADRMIEQTVADALAAARVRSPRRWCCPECRDDWERQHARQARR